MKIRFELGKYNLYLDDGSVLELYSWVEGDKKNADGSPKVHLRHKRLRELAGREYISKRLVDKEIKANGEYIIAFKSEAEHRSGLGWESHLSANEAAELAKARAVIDRLKAIGIERAAKPLTEAEKIKKQIAALEAKLGRLQA